MALSVKHRLPYSGGDDALNAHQHLSNGSILQTDAVYLKFKNSRLNENMLQADLPISIWALLVYYEHSLIFEEGILQYYKPVIFALSLPGLKYMKASAAFTPASRPLNSSIVLKNSS